MGEEGDRDGGGGAERRAVPKSQSLSSGCVCTLTPRPLGPANLQARRRTLEGGGEVHGRDSISPPAHVLAADQSLRHDRFQSPFMCSLHQRMRERKPMLHSSVFLLMRGSFTSVRVIFEVAWLARLSCELAVYSILKILIHPSFEVFQSL